MPENEGETVPVAARLPRLTLDRLRAQAELLDRPVAWCIRRAVEEWLDREGA